MDFEKAIKRLEALLAYSEKWTAEAAKLDAEALKLAIGACEKQIQKKPEIARNCNLNALTLICPNCRTLLQSDIPYCKRCGQALNWREIK